jgi:hypothetical protein
MRGREHELPAKRMTAHQLVQKESIVTRTHWLCDVVLLRSLGDHRAAVVLHHPTK